MSDSNNNEHGLLPVSKRRGSRNYTPNSKRPILGSTQIHHYNDANENYVVTEGYKDRNETLVPLLT